MNVLSKETRFDVHRAITDTIIAAIEAGAGEFVMPWHGSGAAIGKPENARTKMEYHGINVLVLWASASAEGFGSGYWASYKQWQQLGAQVRSGEHGTTIVFYKRLEYAEAEDDTEEPRQQRVARASRVFNADQVSGWELPVPRRDMEAAQISETVSAFIEATKAAVIHTETGGAFYDIHNDTISMPSPLRFVGSPTCTATEAYQATLLHEAIHWSGAHHRLDRKLTDLTRRDLAMEELIAELGAAFLCADLEVTNSPRPDHAAYISNWLELLRGDKRAVFAASRLAHQAAVYLHGLREVTAA